MIVYNNTVKIHPAIEKAWVQWQQQVHIPAIMATGRFTDYKMFRLLEQDEEEGITYVIQYFSPSQQEYEQFIEQHAALLQRQAQERWGDLFIAFRTVMQVVN
ncbi:MAG: DUF4286 family protein [Chitinophagaceae bacterium]